MRDAHKKGQNRFRLKTARNQNAKIRSESLFGREKLTTIIMKLCVLQKGLNSAVDNASNTHTGKRCSFSMQVVWKGIMAVTE